jgi:hypothetical protein
MLAIKTAIDAIAAAVAPTRGAHSATAMTASTQTMARQTLSPQYILFIGAHPSNYCKKSLCEVVK